jgi:hypothetical protein
MRRSSTRQEFWNDRNFGGVFTRIGASVFPMFRVRTAIKGEKMSCFWEKWRYIVSIRCCHFITALISYENRFLQVGRISVVHFSGKIPLPMASGE